MRHDESEPRAPVFAPVFTPVLRDGGDADNDAGTDADNDTGTGAGFEVESIF